MRGRKSSVVLEDGDGVVVPGWGMNGDGQYDIMLIGEAPGREEANRGRAFVGKSGEEQRAYLRRYNVNVNEIYQTNVVKEFKPGNPDPTKADIARWTPVLEREIGSVRPKVIVAVGRFAMRWLLGEEAELDTCWGLPLAGGTFDEAVAHRANGAIVVSVIHPAAGFYDGDARVGIDAGYRRASEIIKLVKAGKAIEPIYDEWAGRENYLDVSGGQLATLLRRIKPRVVGMDTEGSYGRPWSIQISVRPGQAYVLRYSRPDFIVGAAAIQRLANNGVLFATHCASTPQGCMFDIGMARAMGIDLTVTSWWDTMYAAYLMRLEPQGLKALSFRWNGMKMTGYEETLGTPAREKQIKWLWQVLRHKDWGKPTTRVLQDNDGSMRLYNPQGVNKRVEAMLLKVTMEGEDPRKCWQAMDEELAAEVESELGPMPHATLDDVKLEKAVNYASRDSDSTLRLHYRLAKELASLDLTQLMKDGMAVMPAFYEMQATGMPASRVKFERLRDDMAKQMTRLQRQISREWFDGKPFNPKSPPQTAELFEKIGLVPAKTTKTGVISTGKQSIEHLRTEHPCAEAVISWREHQHTKDMFAETALALMPTDRDISWVKCVIKSTRTPSRRLATADPNLLAMPKHTPFGAIVRNCYIAPEGFTFIESDLSQIEVRVLAHESQDPLLISLYMDKDRDFHTETAARVFGVPYETISKEDPRRTLAKRISFGVAYGVSGMGLATQLRMMQIRDYDDRACQTFIDDWLKLYKGAANYFKRVQNGVKQSGMVRSEHRMIRYLPAAWGDDYKLAAEAARQGVNHRIQDRAQGMLQKGLAWLYRELQRRRARDVRWLKVRLVLSIHDSVVTIAPIEMAEEVKRLMVLALEKHCGEELLVPVKADAKQATTWGAL